MNKAMKLKASKLDMEPEPIKSANVSASKKREEGFVDLEQQFILRMPPGPAMALRRDVEAGAMNLKDKLAIELDANMRSGSIRYGGQVFSAKLIDLPCIIEILKTTDRKSFYKTADVCQMLKCISDDESNLSDNDAFKKKDRDKKFQYPHGITPPLKNVRKKRFRKTLKKKYQEQPDIEKEVKRLFRADNEAIDVKWEVVVEEDKNNTENGDVGGEGEGGGGSHILMQGESFNLASIRQQKELLGLMESEIFGEISSSDEDEKDVNIVDSGDDLSRLDSYNMSLLSNEMNQTSSLSPKMDLKSLVLS